MRVRTLLLLLPAIVAVLAAATGGATTRSGLYGTVVISPAMPVCRVGVPCTKPAAGWTLAFSRAGRRLATVVTDREGSYRVGLAPGRYEVSTPARKAAIGRGIEPSTVTVPRARYARANFSIDVGIR
jgi:hypothetical protein